MEARFNMKITESNFNVETNEEIITERDETDAETKTRIQDVKNFEAAQKEAEQSVTAKAALLARLGITADEAKLLLGGN
jgi:hypothetical protein